MLDCRYAQKMSSYQAITARFLFSPANTIVIEGRRGEGTTASKKENRRNLLAEFPAMSNCPNHSQLMYFAGQKIESS